MIKHKKRIFYFIFFLSFLPLVTVLLQFRANSFLDLSRFTAQVFGLIGIAILSWQYILSSRQLTKILGLEWLDVINLHKFLGIFSVLFIFSHPVLMIIGYGDRSSLLLSTSIVTDFDKYVSLGKIGITLILLTVFTSRIARSKISFRVWKRVHFLNYLIFPLIAVHALQIGILSQTPLLTTYLYALCLVYGLAILIKIFDFIGLFDAKYIVVNIKSITNSITEYELKPVNKALSIKFGNYIYLRTSLLDESHPFTVSHIDLKTIKLSIKSFGKFSSKLSKTKLGDTWLLQGPYGTFTSQAYTNSTPFLVIAGGIGITPFLELAKNLGSQARFTGLIYANRTEQDVAYLNELTTTLKNKLINVISGQEKVSLPNAITGFVTKDVLLAKLTSNPETYHYYICGPQVMMTSVINSLQEVGVPSENIFTEEFSF